MTALLGAVLATQLHANVQRLMPGTAALDLISPQSLAGLSPSVRSAYTEAFVASLSTAFLVAAVIAFFGLLVALLLPERPLRETIAAAAEADIAVRSRKRLRCRPTRIHVSSCYAGWRCLQIETCGAVLSRRLLRARVSI